MPDTQTPVFVDADNSRSEEQRRVMDEIVAAGHCPFCWEYFQKYHAHPIEKRGKYWLVTQNRWPYKNTRYHYLVISLPHWEHLSEITAEAAAELLQFCGELEKELQAPGGGVALRFGDTNYSAGTIRHLHLQFLVPEISAPDFEPVRIKIGKDQKKIDK